MNNNVVYDKNSNEFLNADDKQLGVANLMWHIIGKCNLFCDFCFSPKSKNEFDISKLELYMEIFKELGVKKIDISGGEPLLYNNLHKICISLKENDIPFTITTSGFVESDKLSWLLKNHNLFTRIILSINGPNASIHESINHGIGSFNQVCDLAYKLMKLNARLRINTVCTEKICSMESAKKFVELINGISPLEWCLIQDFNADERNTKNYDEFLRKISNQSLSSNIKLITRSKKIYRDYCVLDENGFLYLRGKENNRMLLESTDIKNFLEGNYQ